MRCPVPVLRTRSGPVRITGPFLIMIRQESVALAQPQVIVCCLSWRETLGAAMRTVAGNWWWAWRGRFGVAEVTGTLGAIGGFATGYRRAGGLLAAAG